MTLRQEITQGQGTAQTGNRIMLLVYQVILFILRWNPRYELPALIAVEFEIPGAQVVRNVYDLTQDSVSSEVF